MGDGPQQGTFLDEDGENEELIEEQEMRISKHHTEITAPPRLIELPPPSMPQGTPLLSTAKLGHIRSAPMDAHQPCSSNVAYLRADGAIRTEYIEENDFSEEVQFDSRSIAHRSSDSVAHPHSQQSRVARDPRIAIPAPPAKRGRRSAHNLTYVTEPIARTEAARRSGRPTVMHPSGVEFAIPLSLEAHPIPLSDSIPDNPAFDILKDEEGMPYCSSCHCVLKSWSALEYHIMHVHLKYKSFRCIYCLKEYFYTEDEVKSHIRSQHSGRPLHFLRETREDKEEEAQKHFQTIFVMIREGNNLTEERLASLQQTAYNHMQRFHKMRFKMPEVVARQKSQRDGTAQTYVTMAAPQTLMTTPPKPQYGRGREVVKLVRLAGGDYAQLDMGNRWLDRDMVDVVDGADFDQIEVVDSEELVHEY